MSDKRKIKNALISVFYKDGLDDHSICTYKKQGVNIYSTGGTQTHLEKLGININRVEDLNFLPLNFRWKSKNFTPKSFWWNLKQKRHWQKMKAQLEEYEIPEFDLVVVVDLYPFEETVASGGTESRSLSKRLILVEFH